MTASPPFAARTLLTTELPSALELTRAAGVQGVYVQNHLLAHPDLRGPGELLAFHGQDELLGLAWFGDRGNLVYLERRPLEPKAVARAILDSLWAWRIILGPQAVVTAMVELGEMSPVVHRPQVYLGLLPGAVTEAHLAMGEQIRLAQKRDLKALMAACLDLSASDLGIDRKRINRGWLKRSVKERIEQGRSYVLGEPGKPRTKLDLGSGGPAGLVLEGVYTFPEFRSQGLATALVATVAKEALACFPLVCLHVAQENRAALRAYEKAGMHEMGCCSLMLKG